jgi:hypothetical protein
MNKLEKELVFNFIYQTNVKQDKKRIGEKNWHKIIAKFFPETFGIEVEINDGCFDKSSHALNRDIRRLIYRNSNLMFMDTKVSNHKYNHNDYQAYSIGNDGDSTEMRSFNTIDSIELLQKCNNEWLNNLVSTNFISSLHIHIPISTKVYKSKQSKSNNSFPLRDTITGYKLPIYDYVTSKKGQAFLKKYIGIMGDCDLQKVAVIEMNQPDDANSCNRCLGCDWHNKYFNRDNNSSRRRRHGTSDLLKDFNFHFNDDNFNNKYNELKTNTSFTVLADYIQRHHDEEDRSFSYHFDNRGRLINIQPHFKTFEFRRMTTSNALTIDELLTKVLIVKSLEGFINGYKSETYLKQIIEFLKTNLSIII